MEIFSVAIAYSRCMPDSIVIRGTRAPCYRALLYLTRRWIAANGLPEHLAVSAPHVTNSLVVLSDHPLIDYIRHELPHLWSKWPDELAPAPSECPTIELIR